METLIGKDIQRCAGLLKEGSVIAIPTETVYGLAANALDEKAVRSIFTLKQRPLGNPLIIHLHSVDQLTEFVSSVPENAKKLMQLFSPGPLTYLLPKKDSISDLITSGSAEVAVRFPAHPMTRELLRLVDFPLAAPSANKYTRVSPTLPEHVRKQFDGEIPYILDGGACTGGIESTVIGFEKDTIVVYRKGLISDDQFTQAGFHVREYERSKDRSKSPGLSPVHYSPITPLVAFSTEEELNPERERTGAIVFQHTNKNFLPQHQFILSENGNMAEAASRLYAALHVMDEMNLSRIYIEYLPEEGIGKAVNDRIRRAVKK